MEIPNGRLALLVMMLREAREMFEQSTPDWSATDWLSALAGGWSVFVKSCLIRPFPNRPHVQLEILADFEMGGTARYEDDGESIKAEYVLTSKLIAPDASPCRWPCRLRFETSSEGVAISSEDASSPETPGVRSGGELRFVSDYHDGCVFWRPFAHIGEGDPFHPDMFSLLIRKVSPSCWLLDACFFFHDDNSVANPPTLFRTEWWHCRTGTKPVVDDVEQQLDAAKAERGRAWEAIDEQRARLEAALATLDQKVETLDALEVEEERLRSAFERNVLGDALQAQHRELLGVEPSVVGPMAGDDPIGHELSTLLELEQDASLLESGMSSLADSVEDVADDVAAALWTEAQYARGQRLLTRFGDRLPPVDMTFLGSSELAVSNMKADSQALLASALRQYALAITTDAYQDHDCSPVIAALAKCCERAFADVFDARLATVISDPVVAELLAKPKDWEYTGPREAVKLHKGDYCKILSMVNGKGQGWSGTRNAGIALLLFGGRVQVRKGSRLESPNPLGMNASDPALQQLPQALIDFQEARNGFIHHDLATLDDMNAVWSCFQRCIRGLLRGFYTRPGS